MAPLIEIENVVKRFGSFDALKGVSLSVGEGTFTSLLGPSGCGKTTMLNIIAGFIHPTQGRVSIGGEPMEDRPPNKRNLGMVFQSYALFPHLSVAENVGFGLKVRGVAKDKIGQRVQDALRLVHLEHLGERLPRQLSGGQRQRVALARAIVIEPTALLLDEPLSALDANLRDEMRTELRLIQRKTGLTMIFVTHDQGEALSMSDRVVVMNNGLVEQDGTPDDIYNRSATPFVARFIGEANLFEGRVERVAGKNIKASSGALKMCAPTQRTVSTGDKVLLSVRPEAIRFDPPDNFENRYEGVVELLQFLGSVSLCTVRVADVLIRMQIQNDQGMFARNIGDPIRIGWETSSVRVLHE